MLADMLEAGVRRVVMEVSSHGIALRRVAGMRFAGALFTNLSRDHLDLHGSMEKYYATKKELFYLTEGPKVANAEDPWGRRLRSEEHTSELQSRQYLVCRLLLEKNKKPN